MAGLRLNLLGGFELLSRDGAALPLPPRKAKALLAYLALGGPRPHARDKLASLLWSESSDTQARTSLRQALSVIRKSLDHDDCIAADSQTVAIRFDLLRVDAIEFEQSVAQGGQEALWHAVELYSGDLLDGFVVDAPEFEAWRSMQQERLRRLAVDAMSRLADEHARRGEIERAIAAATRLIALDPLREETHRALMRLYLKQGRQAAALRQYQMCRETLQRELRISPEPETDQLYRELLQRRRAVAGSSPAAASAAMAADEHSIASSAGESGIQLREAAVMLVDIAGLEALAETEEAESLHELLTRYRSRTDAIVEQFGGRTASRVGGRLVAVFGAPVAHGNDAERCVRAALVIARAVTELRDDLQAHIGIASGLVLAEQQHETLFVTGEPLGLATRIMEASAPGEVWVASPVHDALATRLDAQRLPDVRIQSLNRPIPVWRVAGWGQAQHASMLPLVGRRTELQLLAGIAAQCAAAHRGQVILIRGEAGVGKSRLIEEFERLARMQGMHCHKALVFDVAGEGDEDPILQLLRSLLGVHPSADPGALHEAIARTCAEATLDEQQQLVLHPVLGMPQPAPLKKLHDAMDHESRQRATQRLLCTLAEWRSTQAPRLVIVEDVHWATRQTLAHLAALAASAHACPLVLIMSARENHDPIDASWRAAARGAGFTAIDLAPLSEAEAREMASHYGCDDAELLRSCIARAQGNPLFLDQLLRSLEAGRGPLPGSVQSIVLARMDRLAPADRQALQAASVLGQHFSLPALRELTDAADEACARLVEQVLIRPDGENFLFIHALVQEAVYASILRSKKRELHALAARWYATRDLALYAEHLDLAGDPEAAQACITAARAQARRYQHERALRLAERAVALTVEPTAKFEAAELRARLLLDLGRVEEAVEAYHACLALAAGSADKRQALTGLAAALRICDRHREALAALDEALRVDGNVALASERAEIHLLRGAGTCPGRQGRTRYVTGKESAGPGRRSAPCRHRVATRQAGAGAARGDAGMM